MSAFHARWLAVCRFLGQEAAALDDKDWDSWLALYHEDAEFWVPAWDDHERPTNDPEREVSLIYYPTRAGLEDRVFRIRTHRSAASTPAPRTAHLFTLLSAEEGDGLIHARTSWSTTSVLEGKAATLTGWAFYDLEPSGDSFVIRRKKTVIVNDLFHEILDVYSI
ncbi:aromatic-ring-hydroxylating dioxygenase subunit beta [Hoeflea sp.]|uniref:aromatic-ring-hydroxylating dioxygenase subunit beta n=1 Tax=Hoeflea sp. TaxID=1940281 RepID=UPI0025C4A7F5|nr:aromatic-ring-hydroxylating dioxygenase subunit beta [Hoeflea sp.]